MDFSIEKSFDEKNNRWQTAVKGEIDIFNSNEFKTTLLDLIEQKNVDIKIDCSCLNYIDSTGLGALIAVLKKTKEYDGSIYLSHPKSNLEKLFKITNLDKVFIIEGDKDE